jgi:hypothetical protein
MPRSNTRPTITLALTASGASRAMSLPVRVINEAIDDGSLALRQIGGRRLIAVFGEAGLEERFLKFPRVQRKVSHAQDR